MYHLKSSCKGIQENIWRASTPPDTPCQEVILFKFFIFISMCRTSFTHLKEAEIKTSSESYIAWMELSQVNVIEITTLQSMMNAKLSQHRFWHCHENGLIKTIQTITHNLFLSFKSASLYSLLWIKAYPGLS